MRQGLVRGLALCALAVVTLAPGATAAATGAGVGADGTPSASSGDPAEMRAAWDRALADATPKSATAPSTSSTSSTTTAPIGRRQPSVAAAAAAASITVDPATDLFSGDEVVV